MLPASRYSRYNTLHFASKAVCQREAPFGNPLFCREAGATHKIVAAPHPPKTQAGGIGQPVPGADLCRLLAYMGAYCIAHINRSNLLLPYAQYFYSHQKRKRSAAPLLGILKYNCLFLRLSSVCNLASLCLPARLFVNVYGQGGRFMPEVMFTKKTKDVYKRQIIKKSPC